MRLAWVDYTSKNFLLEEKVTSASLRLVLDVKYLQDQCLLDGGNQF
jgi:hypothetical protein